MKIRQIAGEPGNPGFPSADELAALRGWYAGLPAREAVVRYLGQRKVTGQSSRSMISAVRRQLVRFAVARQRQDFAELFVQPAAERIRRGKSVLAAIDGLLRHLSDEQQAEILSGVRPDQRFAVWLRTRNRRSQDFTAAKRRAYRALVRVLVASNRGLTRAHAHKLCGTAVA